MTATSEKKIEGRFWTGSKGTIRTTPLYAEPGWQEANAARLEEFFPEVDPGVIPAGSLILAQIRTPKTKSKGGIIIPDEGRDNEAWNIQTARVVHLGPMAFKNRNDGVEWPEGAWCQPGDFIRVKKWLGDRWKIDIPGRLGEKAMFILCNDLDVVGHITTDPFEVENFNLNI